jgi:YjbE family integral membrane protein
MVSAAASWLPVLEILWIDILLSGDNAVVIALACRSLPAPKRRLGIALGSGAAVALRVLSTLAVVELLGVPFLKILGGALLLFIAVKLLEPGERQKEMTQAKSVWSAVRVIAVADAVMSLDNMVAVAAAAKGSKLLILFGLALSVPLLVFGSSLVLLLLDRFPVLVWAGAVMLGWIAGDLAAADPRLFALLHASLPGSALWAGPAGAALVPALLWLRRWRKAAQRE